MRATRPAAATRRCRPVAQPSRATPAGRGGAGARLAGDSQGGRCPGHSRPDARYRRADGSVARSRRRARHAVRRRPRARRRPGDPGVRAWTMRARCGSSATCMAICWRSRRRWRRSAITQRPGDSAPPRIVFLGDFFDDEGFGLEVLLRVFELILEAPERVCVIAGNHDEALSYDGSAVRLERLALRLRRLPERQPRARMDRARRQARGAADRARAARALLPRRAAGRAWRLSAGRPASGARRDGRLERSGVPVGFRLGPGAPEGAQEDAEPLLARQPVRLRGFRRLLRAQRAPRAAGHAHGARPRPRRRALRDLSRLPGASGADDGGAFAPAAPRAVRALRARADLGARGRRRPCRRSTSSALRRSSSTKSFRSPKRTMAASSKPTRRRSHERGPALPELRHHEGHARRVRGVPRGAGPLLLHEPHARPLAGCAHLLRNAARGSAIRRAGPRYPPRLSRQEPAHRPLNLHARPHRSRRPPTVLACGRARGPRRRLDPSRPLARGFHRARAAPLGLGPLERPPPRRRSRTLPARNNSARVREAANRTRCWRLRDACAAPCGIRVPRARNHRVSIRVVTASRLLAKLTSTSQADSNRAGLFWVEEMSLSTCFSRGTTKRRRLDPRANVHASTVHLRQRKHGVAHGSRLQQKRAR